MALTVEPCVIVVPLTVSAVNGVTLPAAPVIVAAPLAVRVKDRAPSMVLEKERIEPVSTTLPVKVTGPVSAIGLAVVLRLPPRLIAAAV